MNRVPASVDTTCGDKEYEVEGYLCPECNQVDCDRCDNLIAVDEDITPYDLGLEDGDFDRVHFDCLTNEEKNKLLEHNNG